MPSSDVFHRWTPYGWLLAGLAVLYVVWIGVSRSFSNRALEQAAESRVSRPAVPVPDRGPGVRIVQFYSGTGEIVRGEHAVICYGVENAETVRLSPPVEDLRPSLNRCFAVKPDRDTAYTLLATGKDGHETSASFTIQVAPAPPHIEFIALSSREVRRGEALAICYGVENAKSVRLDPLGMSLVPSEKSCVQFYPAATLEYTLIATSPEGKTDRERFKITVK